MPLLFFVDRFYLPIAFGFFQIELNYPQALYVMGTVYRERGEWGKAINMFEKAIEILPEEAKKTYFNSKAINAFKCITIIHWK